VTLGNVLARPLRLNVHSRTAHRAKIARFLRGNVTSNKRRAPLRWEETDSLFLKIVKPTERQVLPRNMLQRRVKPNVMYDSAPGRRWCSRLRPTHSWCHRSCSRSTEEAGEGLLQTNQSQHTGIKHRQLPFWLDIRFSRKTCARTCSCENLARLWKRCGFSRFLCTCSL